MKGDRGVSRAKLEWKKERGARALQAENTAPAKTWSVLCSGSGVLYRTRGVPGEGLWNIRLGEVSRDSVVESLE